MKADEQLKCKDCDWYGSCEYYDRRKETSQICKMFNNTWKFVAELEKIRAEIENHCGLAKENHCKYCSYCTNLMGVREILETIDKYKAEIEELKGENNAK